jgi:hypothetical protein
MKTTQTENGSAQPEWHPTGTEGRFKRTLTKLIQERQSVNLRQPELSTRRLRRVAYGQPISLLAPRYLNLVVGRTFRERYSLDAVYPELASVSKAEVRHG